VLVRKGRVAFGVALAVGQGVRQQGAGVEGVCLMLDRDQPVGLPEEVLESTPAGEDLDGGAVRTESLLVRALASEFAHDRDPGAPLRHIDDGKALVVERLIRVEQVEASGEQRSAERPGLRQRATGAVELHPDHGRVARVEEEGHPLAPGAFAVLHIDLKVSVNNLVDGCERLELPDLIGQAVGVEVEPEIQVQHSRFSLEHFGHLANRVVVHRFLKPLRARTYIL
jgi:hypothetical protein